MATSPEVVLRPPGATAAGRSGDGFRPGRLARLGAWVERHPKPVGAVALLLLVAVSAFMRTRLIGLSFWMDEGLSVGIASHDLLDIPGVLEQDGSPPLYYMVLNLWMDLFGSGETAVHWLSLTAVLLSIPAALWAGWSLFGARAGWIAAILVAFIPFLTQYGQEARMYAFQGLFGILAIAAYLHVFAFRRRKYLPLFVLATAAMLYTHAWGIFFATAAGLVTLGILARGSEADDRKPLFCDFLIGFGAALVLFLPWVPTLLGQLGETAAPWSTSPRFGAPVQISRGIFGGERIFVPLLLVAGLGLVPLLRRRTLRGIPGTAWILLAIPVTTLALAWILSQISPAWAVRYMAVIVGALLLLAALGLARVGRFGLVALAIIVFLWANPSAYTTPSKSNVRDIAQDALPLMKPGDIALSGQPEQAVVMAYYLGPDKKYGSTLGLHPDPYVMDWRNAVDRLGDTSPTEGVRELVGSMKPGQRLLFMRPLTEGIEGWKAPWTRLVRRRSAQWTEALSVEPRLRRVDVLPRFYRPAGTVGNSAVLYERTRASENKR